MVNKTLLKRRFEKAGLKVQFREPKDSSRATAPYLIDVRQKKGQEIFDIFINEDAGNFNLEVIDVKPKMEHLLLLAREENRLAKFLCGVDERGLFVAPVPNGSVRGVYSAMEALKPKAVLDAQTRKKVSKRRDRVKRKTAAYKRQGEWFFIPEPDLKANEGLLHKNEPLLRNDGGKPHFAETLYREGGNTVYMVTWVSNEELREKVRLQWFSEEEKLKLVKEYPELNRVRWSTQVVDMTVFVRGNIKHPDHKTIFLNGWHRVEMNTEGKSWAGRRMLFLD